MDKENKQSPNEFLDNSNCRKKSNIDPNFDHCRYMLDSEMNICYTLAQLIMVVKMLFAQQI